MRRQTTGISHIAFGTTSTKDRPTAGTIMVNAR
jgi:hypothetical protein